MKYSPILFLLALTACHPHPLSLNGRVFNEQSAPLPDATVILKRRNITVRTDDQGAFTLPRLRINDTLLITAPGYHPQTEVYDHTLTRRSLTLILHRK
jgi:hypothetical protein